MKELEARWKYDCGHCKLSWCCGPLCQCGSGAYNPAPATTRRWYSIKLGDGKDDRYSYASGRITNRIAEITPVVFKVGDVVTCQIRGRKKIKAKVKKIQFWHSKETYRSTKDQEIACHIHLKPIKEKN